MKGTEARSRGGVRQALGTFVLGAAAGSVLALLYAPASGRVTRKRISMKFRAVRRSATVLRDQAARKISDAREWITAHTTGNGHGRRLRRQHVLHHA